jgi:hypothetical protein
MTDFSMSHLGQKPKYSIRAQNVCFASENGHCAFMSTRPSLISTVWSATALPAVSSDLVEAGCAGG